MKLVKKDLNAQNEGSMTFLMEDPEDLWHIFNIINAGDRITMTSKRKVAQTTNTGTVTNTKMIVKLTIRVETIDWNGDVPAIRIKGVNTEESRFVKLGQYHTFQLSNDTYNVPFTIHKDKWESVHLDRVRIAVNPAASAQVAAIVLHEGLANLCFITSHMTIVKATIEANIPKKRPNAPSGHDKAVVRFYHAVIDAMRKHINLDVMKCVIIAGPRLTTEQFMKTLNALAVQHDWKDVLLQKSKFVCVHAASGHKHSLLQAMRDPAVASVIADTSALEETRTLERFFELLNTKPDQAYYGYNFVKLANKANAIETLMITDSLFRAPELATRQKYIALVDECKANGVDVKIFSTMHVSGEQLAQVTGVACILRYSMPQLEDEVWELEQKEHAAADAAAGTPLLKSSEPEGSLSAYLGARKVSSSDLDHDVWNLDDSADDVAAAAADLVGSGVSLRNDDMELFLGPEDEVKNNTSSGQSSNPETKP